MTRTVISNQNANSNGAKTIKFLYSYGGKILPRRIDGKLRYVGGHTRVLAVDRSITIAELMVKFEESCGSSMSLKCKLPSEDLDVLVSVTSDEDLANVIEEYDRFSLPAPKDMKIISVLSPIKSLKKISPVSSVEDLRSAGSSADSSPTTSSPYAAAGFRSAPPHTAISTCRCCGRRSSPVFGFPLGNQKDAGEVRYHPCCEQGKLHRHFYRCREQGNPRRVYVTPQRNRSH